MKRVMATVWTFILMFSLLCPSALADGANLLKNGGFENLTSADMSEDWYTVAYRTQAGYSRLTVTDEKAHTGRYSAVVENASSNDARFTCTVKVESAS